MQQFGGDWTEEKLKRLREYLQAYTQIFEKNERAKSLRRIYLDAFAGSGSRAEKPLNSGGVSPLFAESEAREAEVFFKGSARIALETSPSFHQYIFVEKDAKYRARLEKACEQFPNLHDRILITTGDANVFLGNWCEQTDWRKNRAVVFLDPYGMQVDWSTIEKIAGTEAIDLWILYPLGQAVNRLLMRKGPPTGPWADRLTRSFGSDEWITRFYKPSSQGTLFGTPPAINKEADFDALGNYFLERLGTVFTEVARNTLALQNSKGIPLFLLCFAAGNPKGAKTAVRIANYILRNRR
jgi:three-Cys-motif partner protein